MPKVKHSEIINRMIKLYGYNKYLEIGVDNGISFNKILATYKDGVDPAGNCNYPVTSDDFFSKIDKDFKYDIIFVDGLHLKQQVLKDIDNSLNHLVINGTIVVHDCNPIKKEYASEKYKTKVWNGTVWEAWAELRMSREDLEMFVVNTDHGCGVIRRGKQKLFPKQEIEYSLLDDKRKELLNLISTVDFFSMCDGVEKK